MQVAKDDLQWTLGAGGKRLSCASKPRFSLKSVKSKILNSENEAEIFKIQGRVLPISLYKGSNQGYLGLVQEAERLFQCFQYEEASKYYKQAIILDKKVNFAVINLSAVLISLGSYKKAVDTLEKICLKKEEFVVGMFNKALCLALLKEFNTANSILTSIEKYIDPEMEYDLRVLKIYSQKQNDLYSTPKLKLNKSRTILSNFKFPYFNSQSTDRLRKNSELKTMKSILNENSPSPKFAKRSFPRPLIKISNAYQNFVSTNKRRTTNIVVQMREQNEITGKDFDVSLKLRPTKVFEISNKISELVGKGNQEKKNVESVLNNQLTTQAITEIRNEYCRPCTFRNFSKVAAHLKFLSFFSKFSEPIIMEIIKKSELEYFNEGQMIISQGDLGDKMFIILTGIVNVMKKSKEYGSMEIQVNTLYQGETFGEMALLAESDNVTLKRTASCVAGQDTILIFMFKKDYKHILLHMIKNDIHGKASFLCGLSIFPGTDHYGMVPLAANIEPVNYSINEIILENGEVPQGLYIIYEGRCTIKWEGYILRRKSGNRKALTRAPKPFLSSRVPELSPSKHKISTETFDPRDCEELKKASQYLGTDKLDILMKKYEIYKKSIELYKLGRGDIFGGRALSGHDIQVPPAKFTVVADSLDMKVFVLTFKHFSFLPESVVVRPK